MSPNTVKHLTNLINTKSISSPFNSVLKTHCFWILRVCSTFLGSRNSQGGGQRKRWYDLCLYSLPPEEVRTPQLKPSHPRPPSEEPAYGKAGLAHLFQSLSLEAPFDWPANMTCIQAACLPRSPHCSSTMIWGLLAFHFSPPRPFSCGSEESFLPDKNLLAASSEPLLRGGAIPPQWSPDDFSFLQTNRSLEKVSLLL